MSVFGHFWPIFTYFKSKKTLHSVRNPFMICVSKLQLSTVKSHATLSGKFSQGSSPNLDCQSLLKTQLACLLQPQRATLPRKTLICLLHSLAALVSSQPTSCFAHELPFSVANAGQQTSFSIEALNTSIRGAPCKNFPLTVIRI